MRRTKEEAVRDKRRALKEAEDAGEIADSLDVRQGIMSRVKSGEITLAEGQAELKAIRRNAKRNGQKTRESVYRNA